MRAARAPERAAPIEELYPQACRTVPEMGTCANDLNVTLMLTLTALGVNLRANEGQPTAGTILSHAVTSELFVLDLIIGRLRDSSPEQLALTQVRERLALVAECADTLSQCYAATSRHTLATATKSGAS